MTATRHGSATVEFPSDRQTLVTRRFDAPADLVFDDGVRCGFHGTFLEIERPVRTVQTWVFEGRPDDETVETVDLHEVDGVTTLTILTILTTFEDRAARDSTVWTGADGVHAADGMQGS
jgi:uncharacterized protein YndB with AHSA1/START domain